MPASLLKIIQAAKQMSDLQLAQEDTEDTAAKSSRPDTRQPLVHANNNAGSISAKVERGWTLVDSVCAGHPFMRRC